MQLNKFKKILNFFFYNKITTFNFKIYLYTIDFLKDMPYNITFKKMF